MGNVCSSGQSKKKHSASEKSEDDSFYNIENTTEDAAKLEEKKAPRTKQEEESKPTVSNNETPITSVPDSSHGPEQAPTDKQQETKDVLSADFCELLGKSKFSAKAGKKKKIVMYILSDSSSDCLKHKRLMYSLQAQLERKCQVNGFEFIISDVHDVVQSSSGNDAKLLDMNSWTEYPLNAQEGHEDAVTCLSEMKRHLASAYLIPILFFDSLLGRPILPLEIERQDFLLALNGATQDQRTLLEKWYALDNLHEPPCYHLHTQQVDHYNGIDQSEELNKLLHVLISAASNHFKGSYISTVVEHELLNTVFTNSAVAKRCIWIQTDPQYTKSLDCATPLQREMAQRISKLRTELNTHISERNSLQIPPTMHISDNDVVCAIGNLLDQSISTVFEEHSSKYSTTHNTNGIDSTLIKELQFIKDYTVKISGSCSSFDIMNDVKRYIEEDTNYPLIISGPVSCGKTMLSSKIAQNVHEWKKNVNVVLRYAKLTAHSSDLVTILGSVASQMSVLVNGVQTKMEHTLEDHAQIFCDIIHSRKSSFVIIIDAIDDLLEDDIKLDWLPLHLYNTCKIVLTVTEGNGTYKSLMEKLRERDIPERGFLRINTLSEKQWSDILNTGGAQFSVTNGVVKIPHEWKYLHGETVTVFHAKLLLWLASLRRVSLKICDISQVSENILHSIESKISADYAEIMLLIICLSKWGIRESDCIGIFKSITKLDEQIVFNTWAKFCWLMGPMLLDIENLQMFDKTFQNIILDKYQHRHVSIHMAIRDYYEKQESYLVLSGSSTTKNYNNLKYLMVPYHHLHVLAKENLDNSLSECVYFTDLQWIADKIYAVGPIYLIHDINTLERITGRPSQPNYVHVNFLKDFLSKYMHELNYDGHQFLTLLKYYLKTTKRGNCILKDDERLHSWHQFINNMGNTFLEILNSTTSDGVEKGEQCVYDALVNLPNEGYFIASLSASREEVCIWDVQNCTRVRVLEGIPNPTAMCPFGTYDAAVLCRREIKVINMDEGKFKVTLKGVMNQKMPYFGLHDQKHLVCLSRNRMYVNLMNLESGDCVTTFKAGEDRFLNSLLVSGDGRILVCGDETQKPFPLLVWHLSQRKLLYDLRIPCHDFITSLSAITHEGSYVCVVAKELNEPAPNFIVVYDLQSGTLFKKWKPSCNTVALAISQINACVIAGLHDAKILIWDLITGNCRSTLTGHNAPVTCLKLDPLGKVLLSTDRESRDNSLRLWELNSGKSLAVFKPPERISACEILPNGAFVVVALFNRFDLLILALRNYDNNSILENGYLYGKEDNQQKVFKLDPI